MSHTPADHARVTIPELNRMASQDRKIVMLTAYDAVTARIADAAGVDMILVGDSVGNVCLGFENTLPVTMAMMNHHLEAVARTHPQAFLMADMPYLSYHLSLEDTLRNAGGFMQRGAQAVGRAGHREIWIRRCNPCGAFAMILAGFEEPHSFRGARCGRGS